MSRDQLSRYFELFVMLVRGTIYQIVGLHWRGWILLGPGARIRGMKNVHLKGVIKIGAYALLDARFCHGITLGNRCSIGDYSVMRASGSEKFISPGIRLGNHVTFGPYCNIGGGYGMEIGDNCIFGPYVSLHPEGHNFSDPEIPIRDQGISGTGIKIKEDCWFGAKVCVLDGAVVEKGCVIAAGAVLTGKTFEPDGIYLGVPARWFKSRTVA